MAYNPTIQRAKSIALNTLWQVRNGTGKVGKPMASVFNFLGKFGKFFTAFIEVGGAAGEMVSGLRALQQIIGDFQDPPIPPTEQRAYLECFKAKIDAMAHGLEIINNNFCRSLSSDLGLQFYALCDTNFNYDLLNQHGELKPPAINLSGIEEKLVDLAGEIHSGLNFDEKSIAEMIHQNWYVYDSQQGIWIPNFSNIFSSLASISSALNQIAENITNIPDYQVVFQQISDRIGNIDGGLVGLLSDIFQDPLAPGNADYVLNRICTAIANIPGGGGGGGGGITAEELRQILEDIFTWVDDNDYRWTLPEVMLSVLNGLAIFPM